jgi:hypothetical protein
VKNFDKDIKIEAAFCFKKNDNFVLILEAISRYSFPIFCAEKTAQKDFNCYRG